MGCKQETCWIWFAKKMGTSKQAWFSKLHGVWQFWESDPSSLVFFPFLTYQERYTYSLLEEEWEKWRNVKILVTQSLRNSKVKITSIFKTFLKICSILIFPCRYKFIFLCLTFRKEDDLTIKHQFEQQKKYKFERRLKSYRKTWVYFPQLPQPKKPSEKSSRQLQVHQLLFSMF